MMKRTMGYMLAFSVLALGQFQPASAEDTKPVNTLAKDSEKPLALLRTNLNAGFQEFDLSVDADSKLSYRAVKRSDAGEEINEKSFQLSSIDSKSVTVNPKTGLGFSCKNNNPCITFFRNENLKNQRGYNRKINLRKDSFPLGASAASENAKNSFTELVNLYSKDTK
nr:hypothetical protein [Desulfobulbaceae bacterium]